MTITEPEQKPIQSSRTRIITSLILLLILLAGAFLRFRGLLWGEYTYLHPDERFLVWVGTDISPVPSFAEYWDTANSSLNPHNRGHGFYVYGTLPMFLARYAVEFIYGHSGFNEMTNVGRFLSAAADLFTILLVYLVGKRIYNRWVGLSAAAFSAFAVLQIQHAHFFTMDSFTTTFAMLAVYFVARVAYERGSGRDGEQGSQGAGELGSGSSGGPELGITPTPATGSAQSSISNYWSTITSNPLFGLSIGFGIALGMATASKVNAASLALLLPVAMAIRIGKMRGEEFQRRVWEAIGYLILAGAISLLVFRIFQPYAFTGPGFFGIKPNEAWVGNLNELRNQAAGDVDFPPALQWARRPVWFALENMVLWGMGLPMGLAAWAGYLWVGWRILKGEWRRHILLWAWTGLYFTWQSLIFNPSMRYQLLVYPTLAIFAGWLVVTLVAGRRTTNDVRRMLTGRGVVVRTFAMILTIVLLGSTAAYAFAFSNIYVEPLTRVAASRWIYENIPGPINLHLETEDGKLQSQPVPFPYNFVIRPETPYNTSFIPQVSGLLTELQLGQAIDPRGNFGKKEFTVTLSENPDASIQLVRMALPVEFSPAESQTEQRFTVVLENPVSIVQGENYLIQLELPIGQGPVSVSGTLELSLGGDIPGSQSIQLQDITVDSMTPFSTFITAETNGSLNRISLNLQPPAIPAEKTLDISISTSPEGGELLVTAILASDFQFKTAVGKETIDLSNPVPVEAGKEYFLTISLGGTSGEVTLRGAAIANEGDWDDGLPVRVDGHDGFSGIYIPGLNLNMYEDDNPNKLSRFYNVLDSTEYLLISSSRQWGTLPRLPERFPMNSEYYRRLIGCPAERSIEWCFNVAQPGTFSGELGFDLIQVFVSNPSIGGFEINDQPAEEAFTVYDHPKVFIFQKQPDYSPEKIRSYLGAIDLTQVIHVTPKRAGALPSDMMLPADRLAGQMSGGTWSDLFDLQSWQNRWPALGLILWYLALLILGVIVYPLVRFTLPGLSDRGYPLSRIAGLLLLSYLVWLAGSLKIPILRSTIALAFGILIIIGASLAYLQRSSFLQEIRERRKYYLLVEGLFLAFFVIDLLIRIGNPDLWHPWKGGEKPMDFSYFNAVLKSSTFPPYDPWFAGGYINYYYYGFVLVGVLVKGLGIEPAIAYNLIIPTIFSMIALGAFSICWNLFSKREVSSFISRTSGFIPGIAGAVSMAVLGNLGIVRMVYQGYQRLAAPGGSIDGANMMTRLIWAIQGAVQTLSGASLPYSLADWYWLPSRAIPAPNDIEPITEFPFFTVLYGDPHAHLFALPLTLLALTWALSVVLGKAWEPDKTSGKRRSILQIIVSILFGGLAIGVLWPTNTWDYPTFLGLGVIATGYAIWRNYRLPRENLAPDVGNSNGSGLSPETKRILLVGAGIVSLIAASFILFRPYSEWYVQGYSDIAIWNGTHTPFWSYLTHWGAFLFVIVCWMLWETREWMANTPLSALHKLEPYKGMISLAGILLVFFVIVLQILGAAIAWFVLPIAAWAMILLLNPEITIEKRAILVMIALGLVLTLAVEVIVLVGDIGRMNTVFKFYLQVWTLFSLSAAASFGWLLAVAPRWLPNWRTAWQAAVLLLVFSTGLYPLLGSVAKVRDRMELDAPHTLNGMEFIRHSKYDDLGVNMDLSQDYRAIRWMQENVEGSPVIIEGNMVEYHWSDRFTIYTGLPNVIGWNWHQRQQRARAPENLIADRISEVNEFYNTTDSVEARRILDKYNVKYVIVGQLEQALYPGPGLEKFEQFDGSFWREVFRDGDTVLYQTSG